MAAEKKFAKKWIGVLAPSKLDLSSTIAKMEPYKRFVPEYVAAAALNISLVVEEQYEILRKIMDGEGSLGETVESKTGILKSLVSDAELNVNRLKVQVEHARQFEQAGQFTCA